MSSTILKGVIHGKTIELEQAPGFPDGQAVSIELRPLEEQQKVRSQGAIPPVETWMDRLVYDSASLPGERIVKGTCLSAEPLVAELERGCSKQEMLTIHPELTWEDLVALQCYAQTPVGLRRTFGAWAEEAEELDHFVEELRTLRKLPRRGIEE